MKIPTIDEIQERVGLIVGIYCRIGHEMNDRGAKPPEETVRNLTSTVYIEQTREPQKRGGGGGGYNKPRKEEIPKDQQRGKKVGQVSVEGAPCEWDDCGNALKLSSAKNPYCPCWYTKKIGA